MNKELTLEITNYCEKKCEWCSSSSHWQGDHVALDKIRKYLDNYCEECSVVRLSGGEPLAHPFILDIVEYASSIYNYVVILTSGDKKYARVIDGVSYVVNMIDSDSYDFVRVLKFLNNPVSMHLVMAYGNEQNLVKAVELAIKEEIPLRLLKVQLQGRAEVTRKKFPNIYASGYNMPLISWTGDRGCKKEGKITVAHDGIITSCSALKYKDKCDIDRRG